LQLFSARTQQDDFPLEEVLEINSECSLIQIARYDLAISIEEFTKAVANRPRSLEILKFNTNSAV
jgi:hypothetical protein